MDHLGNVFETEQNMCKYWKTPVYLYKQRIKSGKTIKEALTTPIASEKKWKDHKGNKFSSKDAMCKYWNTTPAKYDSFLKKGWSQKEALTGVKDDIVDFTGKKFASTRKMCKYYNIPLKTYNRRISSDWEQKKALITPINKREGEALVEEILNKKDLYYFKDITIKTIVKKCGLKINWNKIIKNLSKNKKLNNQGWTKEKIERFRPDFVIYSKKDKKIIGVIEFDGAQHQIYNEIFFKTTKNFLYRSDADFVKMILWESLNIPLLRIRHDQINKMKEMIIHFFKHPNLYLKNHNTYLTEKAYWEPLKKTVLKINTNSKIIKK